MMRLAASPSSHAYRRSEPVVAASPAEQRAAVEAVEGPVLVLAGAGVGGGSLVYANTLPIPTDPFFQSPSWSHLADWKNELLPHYQSARRMLGAVQNPHVTRPDQVLAEMMPADLERMQAERTAGAPRLANG